MQVLKGKKKFYLYLLLFLLLSSYQFNKKNILPIFTIKSVNFINNNNLEEYIKNEIINYLKDRSLLDVQNSNISSILKESNWVKNFKINKQFPNKITLNVSEYYPIALYQNKQNELFLINNNFQLTNKIFNPSNNSDLIYISGIYEKKQFSKIYVELANSKIFKDIKLLKLLNLNRFDLYLKNNVHIKLGSYNFKKQFNILYEINKKYKEVKYIDLRNANRVIIK